MLPTEEGKGESASPRPTWSHECGMRLRGIKIYIGLKWQGPTCTNLDKFDTENRGLENYERLGGIE